MITSTSASTSADYDVPKSAIPPNYDCPRNVYHSLGLSPPVMVIKGSCVTPSIQEESYDVPRSINNLLQQHYTLTTSRSNSSLLSCDSLSMAWSMSNRSSLAAMPDYDTPRRTSLPLRSIHPHTNIPQLQQQKQQLFCNLKGNTASSHGLQIDFIQEKPSQEKRLIGPDFLTELPLKFSSPLEALTKMQIDTTSAITRLLSFISPSWRMPDKLGPVLREIKLAVMRLRTSLYDLTEFTEDILTIANRFEDLALAYKLWSLTKTLRDAYKLIHKSADMLEAQSGWTLENLARAEDNVISKPPDSLDHLIECAQNLTEDVRLTTSFIQSNASLLFRCEPFITSDNTYVRVDNSNNILNAKWVEDYDYVCFTAKDATTTKNLSQSEIILPNPKNYFGVVKNVETNTLSVSNALTANRNHIVLTNKDKQVLRYFALQILSHTRELRHAIDSFLETVEKNQPPKYFIVYGKLVLVNAYNLIIIGDIIHRKVSRAESRKKILHCTDALSDSVKVYVNKSKRAAAQFPSGAAVQEMVDSIVEISYLASDLKTATLQLTTCE